MSIKSLLRCVVLESDFGSMVSHTAFYIYGFHILEPKQVAMTSTP